MFFLVYVSMAQEKMSKEDLLDILAQSREANAKAGITGMLLYKDGNFMQALEGEETAVRALYARICRDPRHRGILTLVEGERERLIPFVRNRYVVAVDLAAGRIEVDWDPEF